MVHTSVFLEKAVEALQVKPGGLYIDATAGEGGHTTRIRNERGKVLALDWDADQLKKLQEKIQDTDITLAHSNFAEIETVAKRENFFPVDGILFDFGLSMHQLWESGRGLSYKYGNDPLDMRISTDIEKTAAQILAKSTEEELYEIFAGYSEELHSQAIAETIVKVRRTREIKRVSDLIAVLLKVMEECPSTHQHNKEPIYARVFQALRIAVNDEFDNIKKGLDGALALLKPEGRMVVITFHSLEDRIVKQFAKKKGLKIISQKHFKTYDKERFERSAKLRILFRQ